MAAEIVQTDRQRLVLNNHIRSGAPLAKQLHNDVAVYLYALVSGLWSALRKEQWLGNSVSERRTTGISSESSTAKI